MNYKLLFFSFLFAINFSFGQKNLLLEKTLNKDSISAEFTELYNLTNTIHPGEFMFTSKKEFDKTYFDLKKSIKTNLSIIDYYKLTAALMAKIKDGHTTVDRGQITALLKDEQVFPFSIYKINNKYYFDKSTNENKNYKGLQILTINGKNIATIVSEVKKYIHLEGRNESGLNLKFKNFPFYYFIYDQADKFDVEYLDDKNQKQQIVLNGITFGNFTKSIAENIPSLSTEIRKDNIAVLKFHSFANGYNEADRKVAKKQLDDFFAKLDSLKTKNLIIDLRDNGGGSADIANYLFSYLTDKPYYYLDYYGAKYNSVKSWKHYAQNPDNIEEIDLSETKKMNSLNCYNSTNTDDWWFKKQQNKANSYKGKVSVLINGGCFSTTGHFLALLREYKIGKFYGEYSQGSNYSNAGGQAFVLPYSKTLVWIPHFQYKMRMPNFKSDAKGIKPDVEIPLQAEDLKTGFDRQMDFVVREIEKG
ncbi:S41 family peptidase [Empedobacter sedimenti]|uniref:S41 family peptidase n=1 Tax=Empedobacter sedimenti TaxID=3042610 RepID=UPI0024A6D341|nr:S41 family peptidase [Empedobacter sedimenti]